MPYIAAANTLSAKVCILLRLCILRCKLISCLMRIRLHCRPLYCRRSTRQRGERHARYHERLALKDDEDVATARMYMGKGIGIDKQEQELCMILPV